MGLSLQAVNMQIPWHLISAVFLLTSLGCGAPTVIPSVTSTTPGASVSALVLGRIQVYLGGQPVHLGREGHGAAGSSPGWGGTSPWDETSTGLSSEESRTMVVFQSLGGDEQFVFEVADESGRVEVFLPPGRYGIRLRCGKWHVRTPAQFDVPQKGRQYYVGTLRVNLFQRRSFFGWFVRFFGGTLPRDDVGISVADEWEWAQANLQSLAAGSLSIEKRLMHLEPTP